MHMDATVCYWSTFVCILITVCGPPHPLFGIRRLSAIMVLVLLLYNNMETSEVSAYTSVRYSVDVHYWECPLIETPLYVAIGIRHLLVPFHNIVTSLHTP